MKINDDDFAIILSPEKNKNNDWNGCINVKSMFNTEAWKEKDIIQVLEMVTLLTSCIPLLEEDDDFLLPIDTELNLLEKAKQHLIQYSYREVANWLSKESGRYISHVGLKKRIQVERKRKKAATIKRKLATRLEKTLQEIQKLEQETTGSSTEVRA